jgi:uncharacterized protein YjdB
MYVILMSHSSGPGFSGIERTGASGTGTNCGGSGCHVSITPTSSITTVVTLMSGASATTTYTPGGSYTIHVVATNTSSSASAIYPKFGYQVSARAGSADAGVMVAPVGSHTITAVGVKVSEHFSSPLLVTTGSGSPGSTYVVDVPWTAPASGTGTVTLRAVVNAVNGTGGTDGDVSIAGSATITEASTTGPAPITGTMSLCVGATTTLSDATPGGTWTSGTPAVATVGAGTGVVNGLTVGTSVITYATGSGSVTATVTVNANPVAISGVSAVCPGGTTTLTCTTPGGTWSSSSVATATVGAATGVVSGVAAGTCTISYVLSTGCYSTTIVTVNTVPPVTGTNTVCVGASTTLSHTIPGGTWSSSTPAIGTVSTSGVVTGIATGTTTISYTFGTSGCFASMVVTVIGHPAITGSTTACVGLTTTLTAIPAGGTWSSSAVAKATVGSSSGIVTGVATGTVTIKYKVTTACGVDSASWPMTVVPAASCPTGITLTNPEPEKGLQVYPNPNTGNFTLSLATAENEEARVVITNILGVQVMELTTKTNASREIALNQPPGFYFVAAYTNSSRYVVKVLVK